MVVILVGFNKQTHYFFLGGGFVLIKGQSQGEGSNINAGGSWRLIIPEVSIEGRVIVSQRQGKVTPDNTGLSTHHHHEIQKSYVDIHKKMSLLVKTPMTVCLN